MTSRAAHRGRRSGDRWRRRPWLLAALPVLLVALAEPLQRALDLPVASTTAAVGVTEAGVAAGAAAASALRALHELRRSRSARATARRASRGTSRAAGWWLLAGATGSWAAGQVVWVWYESVLGVEVPSPSLADIGFLGFGALAPLAVVALSRGAVRASSRARSVLDGLIIAGALFLLSWTLVMGVVVHQQAPSTLALVVTAAYPVSDAVVLTAAISVLSRTRGHRALVGITAGAALMAVSDSLFVYLSAAGQFSTGGLLDVLWTAAFAVMAASTTLPARDAGAERRSLSALPLQALPYLPFATATAVVVVEAARRPLAGTTLAVLVVLMTMVFVRQALVVLDNAQLTRELQERSQALARTAYTDPLTGVANRAAFTAALEEAVEQREPLVAAFCDLDSFKAVNDACGHATGDALLVAVAGRLRDVVREGDVVARLGGDEFAVLVRDDGDARGERAAAALRERLATALSVPFSLEPALARTADDPRAQEVLEAVSVSLGVVSTAELGQPTAEELLHEADQRMYSTKRSRQTTR
ncbi:diguanylate cyclase domain-containing protein [Quadrisphaera sp. KR29]|uniref:diguanylate cyclase domain-containing protein n=1 Tax=Quadrisphaera sp. KR29 TaxID=3461391 RepID=UPI004044C531